MDDTIASTVTICSLFGMAAPFATKVAYDRGLQGQGYCAPSVEGGVGSSKAASELDEHQGLLPSRPMQKMSAAAIVTSIAALPCHFELHIGDRSFEGGFEAIR